MGIADLKNADRLPPCCQYAIITGESTEDLEAKVQVMLRSGWKLQGGVDSSTGCYPATRRWYQAMILEPK